LAIIHQLLTAALDFQNPWCLPQWNFWAIATAPISPMSSGGMKSPPPAAGAPMSPMSSGGMKSPAPPAGAPISPMSSGGMKSSAAAFGAVIAAFFFSFSETTLSTGAGLLTGVSALASASASAFSYSFSSFLRSLADFPSSAASLAFFLAAAATRLDFLAASFSTSLAGSCPIS